MAAGAALSGVSTVGNLVGGGKASQAQNNATNQAAQQASMAQGNIQQAMGMVSNYIGSISPAIQSLVGGLISGDNGYATNQRGYADQAGAFGNSAANTPLSGFSSSTSNKNVAGFGDSDTNKSLAAFGDSDTNKALTDFNGLKPEELSALTDNAARSGNSDIATAQSRGAFGANQNAAIGSALRDNQLTSENAAINIGSAASQQELSAKTAANSAALAGKTSAASNALSGLESANNASLSSKTSAASNALTGLGQAQQTYGNLVNQQIGGVQQLGMLNPNTTPATAGANTLAGLSSASQASAAGYGNPYAPASASGGQFLNSLMSGKGGKSSGGGTLGNGSGLGSPMNVTDATSALS